MRRFQPLLAFVLASSVVTSVVDSTATVARADASSTEMTLAETLFQDGKKLMDEGKFDEACPKLESSFRIEKAGGTAIFLALCYEGQGRLATAWTMFQQALSMAIAKGREDRAEKARERLSVIEPKLSKVTIEVGKQANVAGFEVRVDGAKIDAMAFGTALPMDPGAHAIAASASGNALGRRR